MSRDVLPVTSLALSIIAIGLSAYMLGSISGVSSEIAELSDSVDAIETKLEAGPSTLDRFGALVGVASERAKVGAAKAELATVKQGLGMFQAENDTSAYPRTATINSFEDLRNVISPYVRLPGRDDVSFTYVSYTSAQPDTFVLTARAKDSDRTVITVTPTAIRP